MNGHQHAGPPAPEPHWLFRLAGQVIVWGFILAMFGCCVGLAARAVWWVWDW